MHWVDRNNFTMGSNRYNVSFVNSRQEFYLSNMRWSMWDVSGGIRNETYRLRYLLGEDVQGDYQADFKLNDYLSLFLNARSETFNDGYFPSKGHSIGVSGNFYGQVNGTKRLFGSVQADAKGVIPMGSKFALIPYAAFRFLIGDYIPVFFSNVLGGEIAGRYVDHQLPFIGINNAAFMRNCIGVARMDLRYSPLKNNYVSGIFNYARDFRSFSTFSEGTNVYGAGIEYAYDSVVGPLKANIHWSSLTRRIGIYVSIGFDF